MTAYQRLPSAPSRPVGQPDMPGAATARDMRPTLPVDLAWIDGRDRAVWDNRLLPDTAQITDAIAALARGALLHGETGPTAIEDLMPGDRVRTRSGGTARIEWIGSMEMSGPDCRLFRVSANAFGGAGPTIDMILGEGAHILIESPKCQPLVGGPCAFAPIAAFEDGYSVTAITPPGAVMVYGLACSGQEAVLAAGLPIETYHPARATARSLTRSALSDMARLFPHLAGGAGFGAPRIPHLTMSEAQSLAGSGF